MRKVVLVINLLNVQVASVPLRLNHAHDNTGIFNFAIPICRREIRLIIFINIDR